MGNLVKFLQALKYLKQFIDWYKSVVLKRKVDRQVERIEEANKKADEAEKISDDAARLEEKKRAAKAIQDSLSGRG